MSELHHKRPLSGTRGHHHVIDYIAEANAVLGGLALYPQLYKVLTTRDAHDLSHLTFFMIGTANTIWILYGIHRRDVAVIISSVLVFLAAWSLFALSFVWA